MSPDGRDRQQAHILVHVAEVGHPEVGVVARPERGRRDDRMVDSFITISQTTLDEHFIVEDNNILTK